MRYRKINNKGSVLRSPWASVFISSEKSKPCDFTFIFPRRTYFCDCLHAKSLYLKYSWLQSEPLPPKSHRKDKFRNLSTCMRTTMCSLKISKPHSYLGFRLFRFIPTRKRKAVLKRLCLGNVTRFDSHCFRLSYLHRVYWLMLSFCYHEIAINLEMFFDLL